MQSSWQAGRCMSSIYGSGLTSGCVFSRPVGISGDGEDCAGGCGGDTGVH